MLQQLGWLWTSLVFGRRRMWWNKPSINSLVCVSQSSRRFAVPRLRGQHSCHSCPCIWFIHATTHVTFHAYQGVKHKLQSRLVKRMIFLFSRIVKTLALHIICNCKLLHTCMHAWSYTYASQWGGHTGHVILKYVGSTASQVSISLQAICRTQHVRILYTCMAFAMHAGKAKSQGSSSDSEASSSSTEIDSGSECEDDAMEDQSVMPLYACTYHAHMLSHADSFHAQRCLLKSLLQICQQMQHHSLWSDHSLWSQLQARLHHTWKHYTCKHPCVQEQMNAGASLYTPPPVAASILMHSHACVCFTFHACTHVVYSQVSRQKNCQAQKSL